MLSTDIHVVDYGTVTQLILHFTPKEWYVTSIAGNI